MGPAWARCCVACARLCMCPAHSHQIDTLDPALIRPGRIDRKIYFPLPDITTKRHIFKVHTSRMNLAEDVDLETCACFGAVELSDAPQMS